MALGKWIGIGAGWFLAGPIGAIIGYYIGKSFFNGKNDQQKAYEVSLLILSSLVIKSDGKVRQEELEYVRNFFVNTFGASKANQYFMLFNKLNKQSLSSQLRPVCLQLNAHINHASRLQIIHFLFGVSASDNELHLSEVNLIKRIASYLNVSVNDFESIYAMFSKEGKFSGLERFYKILEINKNATDEEVKKAHRKMVMKYHPDKLQGVSEDIVKLAEDKFRSIQQAYEKIMQSRK